MRRLLLLILLGSSLVAEDQYLSLHYTSLEYANRPVNNFVSLYGRYEDRLSFLAGDLELGLGVTGSGMILHSGDFEAFASVEESMGLIHQATLDYYPTADILLSVGREPLHLNLLSGSFDGVMGVGMWQGATLRGFYFAHYATLLPAYHQSFDLEHLYGVTLNHQYQFLEGELSYFAYDEHQVGSLYVGMSHQGFRLGGEYLAFDSTLYDQEQAYHLLAGYRYGRLYLEGGYYEVIEGGLDRIYQLGGSEFRRFGLNAFLNHPEASNIYGEVVYNHAPLYAKLHGGVTSFQEGEVAYQGEEIGLTLGAKYGEVELSSSLLAQESDHADALGEPTVWFSTNLTYRF